SVSTPSPPPAPAPSAPQPRTLEEAFRAATPSGAPVEPAQTPPPSAAQDAVMAAAAEEAGAAQAVGQAAQDEAAQWWVSAWARWTSWKGTVSFNDAVKQELQKYRSEEHTSELQSLAYLVCRLLLEKKKY